VRHYARALVDGVLQVVLTPFNPAFETIRFKPDEKSFIVGPVVNALLSFRQ
jgi:SOS-response transcriptional repressor LexA